MLNDDNRMAGFATLFGSMLLTVAVIMALFLLRGFVPPFIVVMLPAIVGAGLLTAGLLHKRDNGWTHDQNLPEHRA
jgi:hypothetical protein